MKKLGINTAVLTALKKEGYQAIQITAGLLLTPQTSDDAQKLPEPDEFGFLDLEFDVIYQL